MLRNTRKGFTLIELLIVVVIIGILAAIAIPKFANTKDKAKIASMKTDLRNFMSAQEGHFADYQKYASGAVATAAAVDADNVFFQPTTGNALGTIARSTNGFNVTMTNASLAATKTCGIYVGATAPSGMPSTANEGEVACW
jgi:prepilin-type N-terminal cleavage/methylation domain-containing protein